MAFRKLFPCFIVFLILVPTLNSQSIWWDEGISIHLAESSWKSIIIDRASNIHPPLYFLLLKLWLGLAGSTPFSARYLSVMATTLLPALVYYFLKHHFNRGSALAGSYIISMAPPFLIYGQEARAYAFLPLFFMVTVMQLWQHKSTEHTWLFLSPQRRGVVMGITGILFVGFHYTGIFAVVLANLYFLFKGAVRKTKSDMLVLLYSSISMIVLAVPWLIIVIILGLDKVFNQAGISNPFSNAIPFAYLLKLLAVFSVIGLPEAVSALLLTRPLFLTLILLLLALLLCIFKSGQTKILSLLMIWLLPFIFVPAIWFVSPQAHPRYMLPYFLGGWLIIAVLASHPGVPKMLRTALLAATLVSAILGLDGYLFNPNYARSDVRSAARDIKGRALPGDIVIVPNTDWSLQQYDTGDAEVIMLPSVRDQQTMVEAVNLENRLQSFHVFLLDYSRNVLDPRGYVRYALSRQGYLVDRSYFHNVFIERYIIAQPFTPDNCKPITPVCVEGENICLEGVNVPVQSVSGTMLPIALCWHHGIVDSRYSLAFRLYTDSGILVSSGDDLLVDSNLLPSDFWNGTADFHSYHRIPLPLGLLPQYYRLEMSVYPSDTPALSISLIEYGNKRVPAVEIAQTMPAITRWVDASPDTVKPPILLNPKQFSTGLTLSGTHIEPLIVAPGDNLYIMLLWQAESEGISTMSPEIRMIQDAQEIARVKVWGKFGEIPLHRPLLDYVVFPVPIRAKVGEVALQLALDSPEYELTIGTVKVAGDAHVYEAPEMQHPFDAALPGTATLIGFDCDLNMMVKSGEPVTVTLFWRAGDNAAKQDLKVFVHLVDQEGQIIAQDDARPVNWTRPTTGWLSGEILTDRHHLAWLLDQPGSAYIVIGLYDMETGTRLMWENGEDALKLPLQVNIGPKP